MLWLALHLPQLSLEAFCATLGAQDSARPVALLAGSCVQAVNAAAARQGVQPGLQRSTALALLPTLLIAQASPARDAAALQAVAHAALAFTPAVTLHDAQTVLLELQSSLRLFGGLAALRQRLQDALAPLGHRLQMAAAPTALGAAWLACWQPAGRDAPADLVLGPHAHQLPALQQLLARAPVGLLGAAAKQGPAWQGMGLHRLADLRALPREGLGRRFGAGMLDEIDRAFGLQADPRRWLALPQRFDSRLELFARAEHNEQVLQGASVLLARLVAWAQAQQARVAAFTLRMLHERQRQTVVPATELRVALAAPMLDVGHLQLLLRERLAHVALAAPTLELQLLCSELVAGGAPNGELFPTRASAAEGLTRLLERLCARLGEAQVQCLVRVADHRPERASSVQPLRQAGSALLSTVPGHPAGGSAGRVPKGRAVPAVDAALPLHRPTWLLPEPLPLSERDALPWLEGRPLQLLSGPERIEAGWWDGEPTLRDYFIAQAADGALVWVYRARLPQAGSAGSGAAGLGGDSPWFLQGRFG
jgi:protein ImuB